MYENICFPFPVENLKSTMEELFLRFSHLSEQIFCNLTNETLIKLKEVSRPWNEYMADQKFLEIRIIEATVQDFHKLDNVWKKVFKTLSKETSSDLRRAVCQFYVKNQDLNFYETVTPLHVAAGAGHELLFINIFKKSKDKYPKDEEGQTPLFYAAQNGHLDIFSFIMGRIEEKNPRQNDGSTPFHCAARNGHLNICKYIMKRVKDKNPRDKYGFTPHCAHNCNQPYDEMHQGH